MPLPTRATIDDIAAVCGYLMTKPTGATPAEMRAVVDKKHLDARKISALKFWGVIEDHDGKTKITESGRQSMRESGAYKSHALRDVIRQVPPYAAVIERVVHRQEDTLTATDVAAHWHDHFKNEVSTAEKILNDQALCFLQVAQGADLGVLTIGRRGLPTRFNFDGNATRAFIDGAVGSAAASFEIDDSLEDEADEDNSPMVELTETILHKQVSEVSTTNNRVFITHGKNTKILQQVKQLLTYGKYEPVVAMEHESSAKPVPSKVMDEMRGCNAAVIHVSAERELQDELGNKVPQINENVLIEIGAAMALYRENFVLLVEEGITLPSNLQGLYECRYQGDELTMTAVMKLLNAFNDF